MHNLKVESYVLFGRQYEDLSGGHRISDSSERLLLRSKGGSQYVYGVLQQRPGSWNIKRLLLIKTARYLKLRNLVLFYV